MSLLDTWTPGLSNERPQRNDGLYSQKEAKEIQDASDSITYNFTGYLRWAPVVDKYFLLDTPRNLRNKGKFEKAKFMITFNSEEGGTTFRNLVNGSSQSFFKGYVTQFAHSQTSR